MENPAEEDPAEEDRAEEDPDEEPNEEPAVAGRKEKGFLPVEFAYGQILCRGGLNKRALPMKTQKVVLNGEAHIFVKMGFCESWLCKAVTGQACPQRTSITRTTLLDDLLKRIKGACDGEETTQAEGAGDPMNEVEACRVAQPNKRRKTNKARKTCILVDLPDRCPEVDPGGLLTRAITLYVVDRVQIWLSLNDVAWAVQYMHDQNMLKGVAAVAEEDTGPVGAGPTHIAQTEFAATLDASAEVRCVASAVAEESDYN